MIAVRVNGEQRDVPPGATVAELLALLGTTGTVAVECNGRVVPRAQHASTRLVAGDAVEIVAFVGGG